MCTIRKAWQEERNQLVHCWFSWSARGRISFRLNEFTLIKRFLISSAANLPSVNEMRPPWSPSSRLKSNCITDIQERSILVNWLKRTIGFSQVPMTTPLVCGIFIMEEKFITTNFIMIWLQCPPWESIKTRRGIFIQFSIIRWLNELSSSLYSCSWDKTVRCFDVETGKEIVNQDLRRLSLANCSSSLR